MINLKELGNKLSILYPNVDSVQMILSEINVDYTLFDFDKDIRIENNWSAALEYLANEQKLHSIIMYAMKQHSQDEELRNMLSILQKEEHTLANNYVDAQVMINQELSFSIDSLKDLLQRGKSKVVIRKLGAYAKKLSEEYQNQIIGLSRRWNDFEKDKASGVLTREVEKVEHARLTQAISFFIDQIEEEQEVLDILQSFDTNNLNSDIESNLNINKVQLEKIMKGRNDLVEIEWLDKAKIASKSICKTLHKSNKNGTGWIYLNKYLFTNNHIISSQKEALETKIIFNFEKDRSPISFTLDPNTLFATNLVLDYTIVKIKNDKKLKEFASLEIENHVIPQKGHLVNIIQHPEGEPKMIAMPDEIISVNLKENHLFYLADTKSGSSGSPVFNQEWKVVALHHGGMKKEDGGLVINENGDKFEANRGTLLSAILEDILNQGISIS